MAINDFLKLQDADLHEVFNRKAYDPTKDRASMVKRLDTAHNQFHSATPTKGKKMWRMQNGVVELTLPFAIAGKTVFHLPSNHFADAISHLKEAVMGGEADEHLNSRATALKTEPRQSHAPRQQSEGANANKSWTDERRAKFAATLAGRKAAKSD